MPEVKKRVKTKITVPDETFTRDPESPEETMFEFVTRKVQESFVGNIPMESVKELPDQGYVYVFGMLSYSIALACLIYFSYSGYREARSKSFVALNEDDGVCDNVPKTVNGQFMGSVNGIWEGEVGFDETDAMYTLHLNNFRYSEREYKQQMKTVKKALDEVGASAANRTAAENLLYWMTWQTDLLPDADESHKMEMTGDAVSIFRREFFFGVVSGVEGECPLNGTSKLRPSDAIFEVSFPKDEFDTQELCTAAIVPEYAGFKLKYHKNEFKLSFDIQSAMVALGVNSGIMPPEKLGYISNTNVTINFQGNEIRSTQNIDVRYPGMLPITCLNYTEGFYCTVKVGDMYFLPVLNHFGLGSAQPDPCDCSRGDGDNPDCNVFDNMVSFLFYNLPSFAEVGDSQLNSLQGILMLLGSGKSMFEVNKAAFNASFAAAQYGKWTDSEWRENAFKFCTFPGVGSCSLVMFNPYDEISNTVSKYYYQVPHAACHDSFNTINWKLLQNTPPEDLSERYLECVLPWYSAIFDSVGIASGNAALAVPVIMFLALPFLYLYMQVTGKVPPKDEYTTEELDSAARAHALFILRVRDSKLRGIPPNGVIYQVAKELISSAKMEGGYPDSDDDSDDEDESALLEVKEPTPKRRTSILISDASRKRASTKTMKKNSRRNSTGGETVSAMQLVSLKSNRPQNYQGIVILNNFKKNPSRNNQVKVATVQSFCELLESLKASMMKALETRDIDGGAAVFKATREATFPLTNVDLVLVTAMCSPTDIIHIYVLMHEIIVMHTSLELNVKMSEVERVYEKSVSYNVGGRLLTVNDIHQLADGHVLSPFDVGIDK